MEKGRNDPTHKAIGPQHFVPDVEVIVGIARALPDEDAVMWIVDRELGNGGAEGGSPFHALADEVDSELISVPQASQVGTDVVFLADPFFSPLHRDGLFLGEGFHPAGVIVGPLTQDLFAGVDLVEVTEKVDDVLGAGEQGQMTEDDDTVETVVYQGQQAAKQLCKGLHRSSPVVLASAARSSARRPVEIKDPPRDGRGKKGFKGKKPQVSFLAQLTNPYCRERYSTRLEPSWLSKFQTSLGSSRCRRENVGNRTGGYGPAEQSTKDQGTQERRVRWP
jgi:hypothetical protein